MKTSKIYLFVILLFLSGCGSDELTNPVEEKTGELVVTVITTGSIPVKGADVIIKGSEQKGVTDGYGQFRFKSLPEGTIEILTFIKGLGSGKGIIKIQRDVINKLDIIFYQGIFTEPRISVTSPQTWVKFAPGDTVLIKAFITDLETPSDSIDVELIHNLEIITELRPNKDGVLEYRTTSLPKGIQKIHIKASNKMGYFGMDSVLINNILPPRVNLTGDSDNNGNIILNWSVTSEPDFAKYEIYRSERQDPSYTGELIKTITDKMTTTFVDSFSTLTPNVYYKVMTYNEEGEKSSSNEINIVEPNGKTFSFTLVDVLISPDKPWLYILDNAGIIHLYNYETRTMIQEKSMSGNARFMDLGENGFGLELYVPLTDGWIKILDPATLSQKTQISCGAAVGSVVIDGKGHIYASISEWMDNPLRVYDRASGNLISSGGDFETCRLRMLPSNTEIIEISTSVSPTDMDYYMFDDQANFIVHKNDPYHGDHSLNPNIFKVSPFGGFLITGTDGSMYKADESMTYIGTIPRGSSIYADYTFNSSSSRIYAGCANEKRIRVFEHPSLMEVSSIYTKGYPFFIFIKGNYIISVSKTNYTDWWSDSYKIAVEVAEIK